MIQKGLVRGTAVQDIEGDTSHICEACIKAKMTSLPFSLGHKHATRCLEQVHSDLCREFEHPSLGGNRYFATLIDNMSGMMWIQPLKFKADFVDWFIKMDTTVRKEKIATHIF